MANMLDILYNVKNIYNETIMHPNLRRFEFQPVSTNFGSSGKIRLPNDIKLSLAIPADCYSLDNRITYEIMLFFQDKPFESRFSPDIIRFETISEVEEFILKVYNMSIDELSPDVEINQ
jgi:hypothetical protein